MVCVIDGKDTLIGILDVINEKTEKFAAVSSIYVEVAKIKPWISKIIGYERGLDGQPWESIIGYERGLDGQPWEERSNGLSFNPDFLTTLIFISLYKIF